MTKSLSKTLLAVYTLFLLWLILFKTSIDISSVLLNYQSRSLNLIPFAGYSPGNAGEMIDNLIVFIPFGLLLGANFKQITFWRKLSYVFMLSLVAEITQYIFAIGTTDITDVITNTLGGLLGLTLYAVGKRCVGSELFDRFVVAIVAILLIGLMLLRMLVFKVRY